MARGDWREKLAEVHSLAWTAWEKYKDNGSFLATLLWTDEFFVSVLFNGWVFVAQCVLAVFLFV